MGRFRDRKVELLIATDVAARGLDVDDIEVVFNYDLPHDAEDYVHRIGRTGRAGRAGRAVTFVAGREIWKMQNIQRHTRGTIRREKVPSLDELQEKRNTAFLEVLRETLEKSEYKRFDAVIDQLLNAGHTPTDITSAAMHLLSQETVREAQKIIEDDPRPERRPFQRDDGPPRGPGPGAPRGGYGGDRPPQARGYSQGPRSGFGGPPRGGFGGPPRGGYSDRPYGGDRPFRAKPFGTDRAYERPVDRPTFRKKPYGTPRPLEEGGAPKRPWKAAPPPAAPPAAE